MTISGNPMENASERTVHIANGIALFAACMNLPLPMERWSNTPEGRSWDEWKAESHSTEVLLVVEEQGRLFDMVNRFTVS